MSRCQDRPAKGPSAADRGVPLVGPKVEFLEETTSIEICKKCLL